MSRQVSSISVVFKQTIDNADTRCSLANDGKPHSGAGSVRGNEIEYICRLKSHVCVTYITFSNGHRKKSNKSCIQLFKYEVFFQLSQ